MTNVRQRRRWVYVAVVVGVLALVGGLALMAFGRGDGPRAVVEDYFDGKRQHDCSYIDLLSADRATATDKGVCAEDPDAYFRDVVAPEGACADFELALRNEQVDGDSATIDYEISSRTPDCEDGGTVYLVREDGRWKVDHL